MTADIREGWVTVRGAGFHYLEGGEPGNGTPAIYVPGYLANAKWFKTEMESLAPRHTVSVSLRGRGKSDAPEAGYSFHDHLEDLAAIISELVLPPFCLIGFSVGVAFALGYAQSHADSIAGLIIQDWPAYYPARTTEWAERTIAQHPAISDHVIWALQRESTTVLLWDGLRHLRCPVLILRGGQPDSCLGAEDAHRYQELLPQAQVVLLEHAGHYLWRPDYEEFLAPIQNFLATLDARTEN